MDCTVVALNTEILIFSCIFNKLFNTFYCSFFFSAQFLYVLASSSTQSTRAKSYSSPRRRFLHKFGFLDDSKRNAMVSSAVVVVSSSTSRVAVTHALKGATVCLKSGGKKVGALEIGSLDGTVTVQRQQGASDGCWRR